jgi:hypothetical protein
MSPLGKTIVRYVTESKERTLLLKRLKKRGRKSLLNEEDKRDIRRLYNEETCPNGSNYTLDKLARLYRVSETVIANALKETQETQVEHVMASFWKAVGEVLEKVDFSKEYLEIEANGLVYRSIPPDEYNHIIWVCWEPFGVVHHFSVLKDAGAKVSIKKREESLSIPH